MSSVVRPPLSSPLADPCAERTGVVLPGTGDGLDVFLTGTVFMDMIFSGLSSVPMPGTELFTSALGSAPGGSANLAVAMSRLGLHVGLAASFGDDMFGAYLWRTLAEQERIDLSHSRQLPGWPTPVTVSLVYHADRAMVTYGEPPPDRPGTGAPSRAASCFIDLDDGPPGWAADLRATGTTVFADVGWDGTGQWSPRVLEHLWAVDVFLPNAVEAMAFTRTASVQAAVDALAEMVGVCVVKAGRQGAFAADTSTGERAYAAAIPVDAVDPTGAGDVFDAGFVFGTLAGWPLAQRLLFANLCAGLSVRHLSGSLGAPCWGEIAAWGEDPDVDPAVLEQYGFLVPYIPAEAADDRVRAYPTVR